MKSVAYPTYRVTVLCVASRTWLTQNIDLVDKQITYSRKVWCKKNKRNSHLAHYVSIRLLGWNPFVTECGMPGPHDILHLRYASWQHMKEDCFQVLCLSPTYELAIQTGEVAAKMAQFCPDIKIRFAVRGEESKWITSTWSQTSFFAVFMFFLFSESYQLIVPSPDYAHIFVVV